MSLYCTVPASSWISSKDNRLADDLSRGRVINGFLTHLRKSQTKVRKEILKPTVIHDAFFREDFARRTK